MCEAILSRKKDQDTKALKNGSCYKQGKISYKAVSSSKFDTDELTEVALGRKICKCLH